VCHQSQSISTFRTLPTIDISCFHSGQQKDSQHDEHSPQHDAPSQPLDVFEQERGQRQNEQRRRAIEGRDNAHLSQTQGDQDEQHTQILHHAGNHKRPPALSSALVLCLGLYDKSA
jgi:hypothetical protein